MAFDQEIEEIQNERIVNVFGTIIIFSFISIIFVFFAMIIIASLHNYGVGTLYDLTNTLIDNGAIPEVFRDTATTTAENSSLILSYLDPIWLIGFITLVGSSLIFSYFRKRENYFSIFTFSVLGIMILTYVGSIIIQVTDWFKTGILFPIFPQIQDIMPYFTWYLDNTGVINLIIISLNVIVNFVDFDFSKYYKRKESDQFDEI